MEFLSLAKQRCSVRKYKTDEIEKEKLDKILEAARICLLYTSPSPRDRG